MHRTTTAIILLLTLVTPAHAGKLDFPASGQTTTYHAEDDGDLQRGKPLHYKVLGNDTVKDLRTGLEWEVKCDECPPEDLHYVNYCNLNWTIDIWDWLNDVNNSEGGKGYAGHNDWRIPNVRELASILDYGRYGPAIDPIFGPTSYTYWTSTSTADFPSETWIITFGTPTGIGGQVDHGIKINPRCVRAVRGGPK